MARLGIPPHVADKILNHQAGTISGVAAVYQRHDFLAERKEALDHWGAHVEQIVRAFDRAGKWLFAICHGVQVLAAAGLVRSRRVTAYENCRWDVEAAGATYVATDQAVRDDRIVTGQTWQSHPEFYRLVFDCLGR